MHICCCWFLFVCLFSWWNLNITDLAIKYWVIIMCLGMQEKPSPSPSFFCSTHLRVIQKKREYPILTLSEKFWVVKRNSNQFLVHVDIREVTQSFLRCRAWQKTAFLGWEGSGRSAEFGLGTSRSYSWLRRQRITLLYVLYTQAWPFTFMYYTKYYLSGYLHHAVLPEQTFPSTFQTKRSARQHHFKLTFLWKGFLTGKDCVNTWFTTSPFWLVLRRGVTSACHHLLYLAITGSFILLLVPQIEVCWSNLDFWSHQAFLKMISLQIRVEI